ncbi:MAG: selenocysteine-specific translation elongation factor [Deltaproteobacteria bacterium]|nr:selenocysteine-specific translation elongation factor [Deltaproteobacteria bacterium]
MSAAGLPTVHRVVGTAGHIDHGKTSLVLALTGVDTDRLAEEKRRGITIVLGFAPLDLGDGTAAGLVDVPGHERFVRTMVAGASSIDLALLVVAADEGVMPQTREHIEICEILQIPAAIVALTKIDRADAEVRELAIDDVKSALAKTRFKNAPIVPCSAKTGEGVSDVREALREALVRLPALERSSGGAFLPIDRAFTVKGFGTVVTGTLTRGRLELGELVEILPPIPGRPIQGPVRIRSLQVFGRDVSVAEAGDRTAASLTSVELESVRPGQALASPGRIRPTRIVDAKLHVLASRKRATKNDASITFHAGTDVIDGRATLLDADLVEPGASAFARLRLAKPIAVFAGQRFVLRGFDEKDAGRTIGGGIVLDPEPPRRRRLVDSTREILSALEARFADGADPGSRRGGREETRSLVTAASALVAERGPRGLLIESLVRRLAIDPSSALEVLGGQLVMDGRAYSPKAIELLFEPILSTLAAHRDEHGMKGGLAFSELRSRLGRGAPKAALAAATKELSRQGKVQEGPDGLRLEGQESRQSVGGDKRAEIVKMLGAKGLEPPDLDEVAKGVKLPEKAFKDLISSMTKSGELIRAGAVFFARAPYDDAKKRVLDYIADKGAISTAEAKTLLGVSRKFLIPFLESLDKANVTARVGEVRRARR